MRKTKRILAVMVTLLMTISMFMGCSSKDDESDEGVFTESQTEITVEATPKADSTDGIKIGATFYSLQNEATMRMDNTGKVWCEENGVQYFSYDGNYDAATQLGQIETMIADGCDAIILNPHDAVACAAAVELAHSSGVPVVAVNTMVQSDLLTSYVGSLDVSAGEDIMNYMIEYMGRDDFSIVIIEGPMGQSAQLQRIEGIENVLAKNTNIKELTRNTANWSRSEAMNLMETWINTFGDEIDAVIAENDEMALGARQAIEAAGLDIPCIGVDGMADAITAIQNGGMIASDFQNLEGQMEGALEAAIKVINGEEVEKEYWIPFEMVTPENVSEYIGKY